MNRRAKVSIALIVTVLVVAGCSSSSTSGKGAAHLSSSTPPGTSTPPLTSAPASATGPAGPDLDALNLQPDDMPAGWKAVPAASTADDAAKRAAMVACVGGRNTAADRLNRVDKEYQQGNNDISSNAQLMKSQDDVTADTALLNSPKINSCYEQAARTQIGGSLPAGGKLVSLTFALTPGANGGPKNVAAIGHGTAMLTVSGQTATIYIDVVFITGNRIEGEVDFTGVGARLDSTLEENLATTVAQRIATA